MSCKCQECGRQFKVDVVVSDNLWEKIKPKNKPIGSGLLCGSCILTKIENFNEYGGFYLISM